MIGGKGAAPFVRRIQVMRERIDRPDAYPFTIPAVKALDGLELSQVTYFIGENGSGKSTILEALAVAAGFNPEGGTKNFSFATRSSESVLGKCLRLIKTFERPKTGYFLRAESFFNVATNIEEMDRLPGSAPKIIESYGDDSLHEQSHGESFMALLKNRFGAEGFYILDEPEAALSPQRQIALLARMRELVRSGSQLVLATHAPIVLAYPGATIYRLDENGITRVAYEEAEPFTLTRDFLADRARYLKQLFGE